MTDRFAPELRGLAPGTPVTVTGYVTAIRKFSDHITVHVRDPFGMVLISIEKRNPSPESLPADGRVRKGDRIRVDGEVAQNREGSPIVHSTGEPVVLGNAAARISDLDEAMKEHASRMLLAQATRLICDHLRRHEQFAEFESRVISTRGASAGLEPLMVQYPGFGCSVPLLTSPAAQVLDFINTTGVSRAFTSTYSFSTTYRFPNGNADLRVVVGKAVGMGTDKLKGTMARTARFVLQQLDPDKFGEKSWLPDGSHVSGSVRQQTVDLQTAVSEEGQPPTLASVEQIVTSIDTPLIEGYRESIGRNSSFAGFTIYPGNFLPLLSATPARKLKDLRHFHVW